MLWFTLCYFSSEQSHQHLTWWDANFLHWLSCVLRLFIGHLHLDDACACHITTHSNQWCHQKIISHTPPVGHQNPCGTHIHGLRIGTDGINKVGRAANGQSTGEWNNLELVFQEVVRETRKQVPIRLRNDKVKDVTSNHKVWPQSLN